MPDYKNLTKSYIKSITQKREKEKREIMDKESFILFLEHEEIFSSLTDKQAGQLIKAIFEYERTKEIPQLDRILKVAFVTIKKILDKNREKYIERCEKNKENGKKGGRPKKEKKTEQNPNKPNGFSENRTKAKKADNEYEYDNDIKIDDSNKYITQLGLDKFKAEALPEKAQEQVMLYKKIIMILYRDKREDILEKLTINILSRCWERMQGKKIDRPIDYLTESILNEVKNNSG